MGLLCMFEHIYNDSSVTCVSVCDTYLFEHILVTVVLQVCVCDTCMFEHIYSDNSVTCVCLNTFIVTVILQCFRQMCSLLELAVC